MTDEKDKLRQELEHAGQKVDEEREKLASAVVAQNDRMDEMDSQTEERRSNLADAVVAQDKRMDAMDRRAGVTRATYDAIVSAANRVGKNSDELRRDVDELMDRVKTLEDYVID